MASDCRLELQDGSGFLLLEDGTGFLLLEQCTPSLVQLGGGGFGEEFRPHEDAAGVLVATVLALGRRRRRKLTVG